jgi:uridine kinase
MSAIAGGVKVIGLAGGTSSGKTSFARAIVDRVGLERVLLLSQDSYYHDPSRLPPEERTRINYDHPSAYDTDLLLSHLEVLKRGEGVPKLAYDYVVHARVNLDEEIVPRSLVLLEGILVLEDARVRDLLDIKIYIDADADVRLVRRFRRDIVERGRTVESVSRQYLEFVRPMHLAYVEPSRRHADVIVPEGAENRVALDLVVARIQELLDKS